jgi:NAD(P)-dependent dehydrogenase (short-subunit alcohol dehydrogenase family)
VIKRLQNKLAIVTGGASGLGEAAAHRLAAEGAQVFVVDINREGADRVAQEVGAAGGTASADYVDQGEPASIAGLFERILKKSDGKLHILFNNAADVRFELTSLDGAIAAMDPAVWDRTFAVNVRGAMLMIKHSLPAMVASGGGSIINTSSGAAATGDLFRPAYASSKGALNVLTKYVATQYGKMKIRCNAIQPGMILTQNTIRSNSPEIVRSVEGHALTPYLGQPEDIAAMVAMLASDDGRFVTGQIITVDGGITAHFGHYADAYDEFMKSSNGGGLNG